MSEKIGLIKTVIRLVKKDEELIDRVVLAYDIVEAKMDTVVEMLRHNVWTIQQFVDLTGYSQGTISNKCRPQYKDGELVTELDHCYPFADLEGLGPKFIVRNEKSEGLLPQSPQEKGGEDEK